MIAKTISSQAVRLRRCPVCTADKPISEFNPNPKTGRAQAYCRSCRTEYGRKHRAKNPQAARDRAKRWRQKNWDAAKHAQYKWRRANPETWKANQKRWREKYLNSYMRDKRKQARDAVFTHYGEACACCGETENMFLSIDHINNDGADHRRALKTQIGNGGSSFFIWLVRNNFPTGFQTLCRNCNWGKHINGGVCPHQTALTVQRLERKLVGSSDPKRAASSELGDDIVSSARRRAAAA